MNFSGTRSECLHTRGKLSSCLVNKMLRTSSSNQELTLLRRTMSGIETAPSAYCSTILVHILFGRLLELHTISCGCWMLGMVCGFSAEILEVVVSFSASIAIVFTAIQNDRRKCVIFPSIRKIQRQIKDSQCPNCAWSPPSWISASKAKYPKQCLTRGRFAVLPNIYQHSPTRNDDDFNSELAK